MESKYPLIYRIGNLIFRHAFFIYEPLYFSYKRYTDRNKISLLKEKITPGMKVLDVGANIGFYSKLLAQLVGAGGAVYAFEPDPTNFIHLKKIADKYKNIVPIQAAIGNRTGKTRLYLSQQLNVDHQSYPGAEGRESIEVPAYRLDDYFNQREIFDFIKIDIQGYDYYAFQGAENLVRRSGNLMVLGEFWPYGLNKAGINPGQYIRLLKELGLKLHNLPDQEDENDYQEEIYDNLFNFDFYASKRQ